jgi:hypothetical protein
VELGLGRDVSQAQRQPSPFCQKIFFITVFRPDGEAQMAKRKKRAATKRSNRKKRARVKRRTTLKQRTTVKRRTATKRRTTAKRRTASNKRPSATRAATAKRKPPRKGGAAHTPIAPQQTTPEEVQGGSLLPEDTLATDEAP